MKTVQAITVTIPNELAGKLYEIQKEEMKNCSNIVAEALKEYIEWKQFKQIQKELSIIAKTKKIFTEQDVDKIIQQIRKKK